MQVYAQQAKDRSLIEHATEIRMRAEIRAGELLREMEKNKGAVAGKTGSKGKPVLDNRPKLSDIGVSKTQSSRWQKLAALPKEDQEAKIECAKRKAEAAIARQASYCFRDRARPAIKAYTLNWRMIRQLLPCLIDGRMMNADVRSYRPIRFLRIGSGLALRLR